MMRILPAIDMIDGKCVRLSQGAYESKKIYHENPVEVAKSFEDAGLKFIHLVDLDGAKKKAPQNLKHVEAIKNATNLHIEFGGGIKTDSALKDVFNAGVDQAIIGSLAISDPKLVVSWLAEFGAERFVLGADVNDRKIATHGWQKTSDTTIDQFIADYREAGATYFLCTDISKDGMLAGSSIDLYEELLTTFADIQLFASGGVRSIEEVMTLKEMGMSGVIIGKALYEGFISLKDLGLLVMSN